MSRFIQKSDFTEIKETNDKMFCTGHSGVTQILQSRDRKISIVILENEKYLMGVNTHGMFSVYYPLSETKIEYPIKAVLMDLDGTTLYSETFWIHVIEETICKLMESKSFCVDKEDIPFVSGHSVSEHLQYCIDKYCPTKNLNDAIQIYFEVSQEQLNLLINDCAAGMQIQPAVYLKEFLTYLAKKNIKVGLVTSGLYEKAYPEIWSVCSKLELGKPEDVYDCIITAGYPLKAHHIGTLGELSAKPHPWLYLETALVGLGIPVNERNHVLGIEDSGAGICSLRAAGFTAIGLRHGNIIMSGLGSLCDDICDDLLEVKTKYL